MGIGFIDFQSSWEGRKTALSFFRAFHKPSFPQPASLAEKAQPAIVMVVQSCSNCIGLRYFSDECIRVRKRAKLRSIVFVRRHDMRRLKGSQRLDRHMHFRSFEAFGSVIASVGAKKRH